MASIYSRRLAEFDLSSAGDHGIYTVGAGLVAVLRDISVVFSGTVGQQGLLTRSGGSAFWLETATATLQGFHQECRVVLEAGDVLEFGVLSGTWQGIISGYELSS